MVLHNTHYQVLGASGVGWSVLTIWGSITEIIGILVYLSLAASTQGLA